MFQYESWLSLVPVIHGSASYALGLRKWLLETHHDGLAIPLPESFRDAVLDGVGALPAVSVVVQFEPSGLDEGEAGSGTYVPIDPCQGVVAAIRFAMGEQIPLEWVEPESVEMQQDGFWLGGMVFPDPYAVEHTTLERYCCAMLPVIPSLDSRGGHPGGSLESEWNRERIERMAARLHSLKHRYRHLVCLCHLQDWPWIRDALARLQSHEGESQYSAPSLESPAVEPREAINYALDSRTHLFLHGELPFITGLYERARLNLDDDANLGIHALKELILAARSSYRQDLGNRARQITPQLISQCLKYIRNQTLLDRRMTPSFYTIVRSAQQMMGDSFAIHLVSSAKDYCFDEPLPWPEMKMGIDQGDIPGHGVVKLASRLPGNPMEWHSLELQRPARKQDQRKWTSRWNPYQQCSWPEEDQKIESFRNRIMERARAAIGADLARTEKFTTSMMDGLDLRETLRHWYDRSLYVKIQPPSIGNLDATIMLFDGEPDPREYSWRATWFAEHIEESTLAFFATPFHQEMLGPGVAVSTYGGAMFLYPPRPIEDIWSDPRLDFADTLEQRLVAAACMHTESRHIALLSHSAPGLALKQIAKRFKRKLVHVPLAQFAESVVQQLRMFHVLNGKHVRSYAAHFIRKA
ncbi:MAG: hypothetical protein FJ308_03655 [Planctomycetes bacterium]|nr:hypothetical protein [Planctomycetota bacterium]